MKEKYGVGGFLIKKINKNYGCSIKYHQPSNKLSESDSNSNEGIFSKPDGTYPN